ncbi:MAG: hypothetical protein Q9213_002074 [Squamulea squamosa]
MASKSGFSPRELGKMKARVDKMETCVQHRKAKADRLWTKLREFKEEKPEHLQSIERQKEHIQSLAGSLRQLQREHYDQHPDKHKEKQDAVVDAAKNVHAMAILAMSTVVGTLKPGHEHSESTVQARVQELIAAGYTLHELQSRQAVLCKDFGVAMARHTFAANHLKDLQSRSESGDEKCEKCKGREKGKGKGKGKGQGQGQGQGEGEGKDKRMRV